MKDLEQYGYARLKRDYIEGKDFVMHDGKKEDFKKGWICTVLDFSENGLYAVVEFNEEDYGLDYGIAMINLEDLEPYDIDSENK